MQIDKPHDYCGIFGVFHHPDAALLTYYGLHALQHRGQESAGIATSYFDKTKGRFAMPVQKDFGLVLSVFDDEDTFRNRLRGDQAIGHNRYSTSGSSKNPANIQPLRVHHRYGNLSIAHNGNLTNARSIRKRFTEMGVLFQSTSDTELILHLIAQSKEKSPVEQVLDAMKQIEGAYCLLIQTDRQIIAVRDPNGFRPLALGKLGDAWIVASETCAFDIIGAEYVRDVDPGEVIVIEYAESDSDIESDLDTESDIETENNLETESALNPENDLGTENEPTNTRKTPVLTSYHINPKAGTNTSQCIFEYVYFSRPDSRVFGENVDKIRRALGKQLANEHPLPDILLNKPAKRPIIFSVPDSSNTAALGYAQQNQNLGHDCKYEIGLIRNHYVGRTFISPGQRSREQKVRTKFNVVKGVIEGRPVIVVDDSIVRGTTSKYLIRMIRAANPTEIHFLVSSPPITHPCFYGMDFPSPEELIANRFGRDPEKIAAEIGVDSVRYLSPSGLLEAVQSANRSPHGYCTACFTGQYPVPVETMMDKEENELV
ncbi:MAG: amidophosphoribosyltransferase [Balneolaceae bacterium]